MNAITELTPLMNAVVSHIDEGVILTDSLGNVVYHNPAAENMLGIDDVDTINGFKTFRHCAGIGMVDASKPFQAALAEQGHVNREGKAAET